MSTIALTPLDLALAASLLAINAAISWAFGLRLERSIVVAAARMVVQLALIGFVLKFIFAQTAPMWTLALRAYLMAAAAGVEVVMRQHRRVKGWQALGLSSATLLFIGVAITSLGVGVMIGPDPGYAPRYVLPILGMVLGNAMTAMTAMSLVLDTFCETVTRERASIEARLALGAQRREAMSGALRRAPA